MYWTLIVLDIGYTMFPHPRNFGPRYTDKERPDAVSLDIAASDPATDSGARYTDKLTKLTNGDGLGLDRPRGTGERPSPRRFG